MDERKRIRELAIFVILCLVPSATTLLANRLCLAAAAHFSQQQNLALCMVFLILPFALGCAIAIYLGRWAFPEKFQENPRQFAARMAYISTQVVFVFFAFGEITKLTDWGK